jgi:hypothetical protein
MIYMPDKRQRFVELAEKRMNRLIDDMRLLGNLANRNNYSYTEEDSQKIISALEAEMKLVKQKFAAGASDQKPIFRL